jgi:cell division protein FtsB
MELVLPEVVHGENGSMTVDYASVSAVLVEAVKELDAVSLERYKKQQEEIEDLRKEMELLKREMEALKKG